MHPKKKILRQFLFAMLGVGFIFTGMTVRPCLVKAVDDNLNITVCGSDVEKASANQNGLTYKGFGLLSCNSTSNLLMDYKYQTPKAYETMLNTLFGGEHPLMNHVKVEMGNDGNNSTGSDACTMRTEDDEADASRSPGFILASDAKKFNPDVKVSILRWEMPAWVQQDWQTDKKGKGYESLYRWYKETILDAYEKYGYMPDYINPDKNETTDPDTDFIKWFKNALVSDEDFPDYISDEAKNLYHNIKIVASDEYISLNIVPDMRNDQQLYEAVDAIGYHYYTGTESTTKDYIKMADEDDKEVWYSEGCGSFSYTEYQENKNTPYGAGTIGGYQSPLAMCDCMIKSAVYSRKTHYIFQPAIGSFYEGSQFDHKELLSAREPWAGSIHFDESIYLLSHFSKFAKTGWENETNTAGIWRYISTASDNNSSGTEHLTNEAGNPSYMTLASPDKKNFSTILVNNSDKTLDYSITLEDMEISAEAELEVWVSSTDKYLEYADTIKPENGSYQITVEPFSIVTVTSLKCQDKPEFTNRLPEETTKYILDTNEAGSKLDSSGSVLYSDDFEYASYPSGYLTERGNEPRYLVDQSGAFYVEDGKLVQGLEQKVNQWRNFEPNTVVGDHRWMNYKASVDVYPGETGSAGIVVRQQTGMSYNGSGYSLQINRNGHWKFMKRTTILDTGDISASSDGKYCLSIQAKGKEITAYIDDEEVSYCADDTSEYFGRIKLFCSWEKTTFDNLLVEKLPADETVDTLPYAGFLIDNADDDISYLGNWDIKANGSSDDWYRSTSETSTAGSSFTFSFNGKGFALIGNNTGNALIDVKIDSEETESGVLINHSSNHGTAYLYYGLEEKEHEVTVTANSGKFVFDAILPLGQPMPAIVDPGYVEEKPSEKPPVQTPKPTETPKNNVIVPTPTIMPNKTVAPSCKAPKLIKLKKSKRKITVLWSKVKQADGYIIQRAVGKKGKFKVIKKSTGTKKKSWIDKKVKKGKIYRYRIRSFKKYKKKTIYSSYSSVKKVKL